MLLRWVEGDTMPQAMAKIETVARAAIDWDRLFFLASRHAVIPLVDQHLGRSVDTAVPAEFRERVR